MWQEIATGRSLKVWNATRVAGNSGGKELEGVELGTCMTGIN